MATVTMVTIHTDSIMEPLNPLSPVAVMGSVAMVIVMSRSVCPFLVTHKDLVRTASSISRDTAVKSAVSVTSAG